MFKILSATYRNRKLTLLKAVSFDNRQDLVGYVMLTYSTPASSEDEFWENICKAFNGTYRSRKLGLIVKSKICDADESMMKIQDFKEEILCAYRNKVWLTTTFRDIGIVLGDKRNYSVSFCQIEAKFEDARWGRGIRLIQSINAKSLQSGVNPLAQA